MFCPKCKYEYREGFEICSDCGAALIDDIPPQAEEAEEEIPIVPENIVKWEFLASVAGSFEGNSAEAFLNSAQIPVMKKPTFAGGGAQSILGFTNMGVDIFVPADCLENARELTGAYIGADGGNDEYDGYGENDGYGEYDYSEAADGELQTVPRSAAWRFAALVLIAGTILSVDPLIGIISIVIMIICGIISIIKEM